MVQQIKITLKSKRRGFYLVTIFLAALLLAACGNKEQQLKERAAELCQYIPDHQLNPDSKPYMTEDFYSVLDTMFNHLPEHDAMDHEWLYYFVTGNGGTIADFEVSGVELTDDTHAIAIIKVRQKWEDGSFDENSDIEEHKLYMEKVNDQWMISDFDNHKKDCIHHIAIYCHSNRRSANASSKLTEIRIKE